MNTLLVGNAIAFIASILMIVASYIKNKKNIIMVQSIQIGLFVISNLILNGISGAIINAANLVRNILCYKNKLTKKSIIIISVIVTVLTLYFNNRGFIGLIPLICSLIYTAFMNTKSTIKLKQLILMSMISWAIYDFTIQSYTSTVFDLLSAIACIISMYQLKKNKKTYRF